MIKMLPVACLIAFVTVLCLHTATANVVTPRDMPIKFPGPMNRIAADPEDDVPASCKDLTYCTKKPENYPEEKFNRMFKDYKHVPQPTLTSIEDLGNRFGDDGENCGVDPTNEPLYKVREKRDQPWRTVIQAPGHDYVQRVRLETCSREGAPCFTSLCMQGDYQPICKQNHYSWEILVAKGENETETIVATLPGSCSCYAKKLDFKSRIGVEAKPVHIGL